jgi:hypothetical protein
MNDQRDAPQQFLPAYNRPKQMPALTLVVSGREALRHDCRKMYKPEIRIYLALAIANASLIYLRTQCTSHTGYYAVYNELARYFFKTVAADQTAFFHAFPQTSNGCAISSLFTSLFTPLFAPLFTSLFIG